jgi:phage baseplate assembly protein V
MGIDRDLLGQVGHLLRPLATRVANTVARAVVQLADDSTKLQLLQLGVLADETVDGAEHHQPYGFSSVPLAGAEAVVVFPCGDRSHPLVIAASDRRYRPTGGEPGQVTMHHYSGSVVTMRENGDIEVTAVGNTIFHGAAVGPTGEGVVVGTGIDPFTGQTYNVLQSASTKVFAKK